MKFSIGLKDCQVSYFSGSGAGGQYRNKHMNCIRLFHEGSGVRVTSQDHREKRANELDALRRLAQHHKFRFWAQEKLKEMEGKQTIEQWVNDQMKEENLEWKSINEEKS